MKKCHTCDHEGEDEDFIRSGRNQCIKCKRKYDRAYYKDRSKEKKKAKAVMQKERRHNIRCEVKELISDKTCVDCGNDDYRVFEFDHIDRDDKDFNISDAIGSGYSFKRIKEEIDKCEIRCANCHRIKTYDDLGWYVVKRKF